MIDQRLLEDLKHAEGCPTLGGLPVAYKDKLGNWTGGYGRLLDQTIDWTGTKWPWDVVLGWLSEDAQKRANQCLMLPEWPALNTACRQNAVIECVYNLGAKHWLAEFPATRRSIAAKDWQAAHDNLLKSPLWIAQVGIGRVTRLANYLLTGVYP